MDTLLLWPSFHLNKPLTRLKNTYRETSYRDFFRGAKIDNDMSNISVDNPDQRFLLLQNLLGWIHSYSSPHFIWTSPWLDWNTLIVKLHTETFIGAKIDNDMSNIFVDNPDQSFLLLQSLLGWIHYYSSPHFIWISPWLDWKTLIVKFHTETFLGAKIDNDMSNIFVEKPRSKFPTASDPTRMNTLLL